MAHRSKTIEEVIRSLARNFRAPESFVEQVEDLFTERGVSLNDDAGPFLTALRDAFSRERNLRRRVSAHRAVKSKRIPVTWESAEPKPITHERVYRIHVPRVFEICLVPGPEEVQ